MEPKKSSRGSRPASASTATRFSATPAMTKPRSGSCGAPARWPDRSAVEPGPCDRKNNDAGKDRDRDRPGADADVADDLPLGLVLRDLAIALLVVLVGRAHRLIPAQVPAVVAGCSVASND